MPVVRLRHFVSSYGQQTRKPSLHASPVVVTADSGFGPGFGFGAGAVLGVCVIGVLFFYIARRWRKYRRIGHRLRSRPAGAPGISLPKVRASLTTTSLTAPLGSRIDSSTNLLADTKTELKQSLSLPVEVCRKRRNSTQSSEDVFSNKSPDIIDNAFPTLDAIAEAPALGTLQYSVRFSSQVSELEVHIISASHLTSSGMTGHCNPYVIVSLSPSKSPSQESAVLVDTTNPQFDETFSFPIKNATELSSKCLHIRVASYDQFSTCRVLGEVEHLLGSGDTDSSYCYQRYLEAPGAKQHKYKIHRGDMLLSLGYQSRSNRITVVILKARNLKAVTLTGSCDPYVKVYLMVDEKRSAKKKTSVKKNTICPIYNESFFFDLSPRDITSHDVCLLFLVMDHNPVRQNNVIGKVEVGLDCLERGRDHWKAITNQPGKQVAKWHTLVSHVSKK